jgi:hypothetical protein
MRWKDVSARKQNGSETDGPRTRSATLRYTGHVKMTFLCCPEIARQFKTLISFRAVKLEYLLVSSKKYLPITYSCTVPLILDHSYLFGILTSSKIAATKVSGF